MPRCSDSCGSDRSESHLRRERCPVASAKFISRSEKARRPPRKQRKPKRSLLHIISPFFGPSPDESSNFLGPVIGTDSVFSLVPQPSAKLENIPIHLRISTVLRTPTHLDLHLLDLSGLCNLCSSTQPRWRRNLGHNSSIPLLAARHLRISASHRISLGPLRSIHSVPFRFPSRTRLRSQEHRSLLLIPYPGVYPPPPPSPTPTPFFTLYRQSCSREPGLGNDPSAQPSQPCPSPYSIYPPCLLRASTVHTSS